MFGNAVTRIIFPISWKIMVPQSSSKAGVTVDGVLNPILGKEQQKNVALVLINILFLPV